MRYSLRLVLLAITAISMFLAFWAANTRAQRRAVSVLRTKGVVVLYDYEYQDTSVDSPGSKHMNPLASRFGCDWFHDVVVVSFVNDTQGAVDEDTLWITQLRNVRSLTAMRTAPRMEYHCALTDVGLERLSNLDDLEVLLLNGAPITDVGLEHVSRLKNLKTLWLEGTNITDAGLARLTELQHLKELVLYNTRVTHSGVEAAQTVLPQCAIYWDSE